MASGNVAAQRRRRKARYRGCYICGAIGAECTECWQFKRWLTANPQFSTRLHMLSLVVDGGYQPYRHGCPQGIAGAGLVLVLGKPLDGEIITYRSCSFIAQGSADAELHAVIRGARWAPGVTIYTDSEHTPPIAMSSNPALEVWFLDRAHRGPAHRLAHSLSVEGRLRAEERRKAA